MMGSRSAISVLDDHSFPDEHMSAWGCLVALCGVPRIVFSMSDPVSILHRYNSEDVVVNREQVSGVESTSALHHGWECSSAS